MHGTSSPEHCCLHEQLTSLSSDDVLSHKPLFLEPSCDAVLYVAFLVWDQIAPSPNFMGDQIFVTGHFHSFVQLLLYYIHNNQQCNDIIMT